MGKGKILVLDYKTLEFLEVEIEDNTVGLDDLYKNIYCDSVEHLSGYNKELDNHHIGMWIDEEGKLKGDWLDKTSIAVYDKVGNIVELIVGNVVFAVDGSDGNTYCLEESLIDLIKKQFEYSVIFKGTGFPENGVLGLEYKR